MTVLAHRPLRTQAVSNTSASYPSPPIDFAFYGGAGAPASSPLGPAPLVINPSYSSFASSSTSSSSSLSPPALSPAPEFAPQPVNVYSSGPKSHHQSALAAAIHDNRNSQMLPAHNTLSTSLGGLLAHFSTGRLSKDVYMAQRLGVLANFVAASGADQMLALRVLKDAWQAKLMSDEEFDMYTASILGQSDMSSVPGAAASSVNSNNGWYGTPETGFGTSMPDHHGSHFYSTADNGSQQYAAGNGGGSPGGFIALQRSNSNGRSMGFMGSPNSRGGVPVPGRHPRSSSPAVGSLPRSYGLPFNQGMGGGSTGGLIGNPNQSAQKHQQQQQIHQQQHHIHHQQQPPQQPIHHHHKPQHGRQLSLVSSYDPPNSSHSNILSQSAPTHTLYPQSLSNFSSSPTSLHHPHSAIPISAPATSSQFSSHSYSQSPTQAFANMHIHQHPQQHQSHLSSSLNNSGGQAHSLPQQQVQPPQPPSQPSLSALSSQFHAGSAPAESHLAPAGASATSKPIGATSAANPSTSQPSSLTSIASSLPTTTKSKKDWRSKNAVDPEVLKSQIDQMLNAPPDPPAKAALPPAHRGFGASARQYNLDGSASVSEYRRNWRCRWCLCSGKFTPALRKGPLGAKTLCNACGMWYNRHGYLPKDRYREHANDDAHLPSAGPVIPSGAGAEGFAVIAHPQQLSIAQPQQQQQQQPQELNHSPAHQQPQEHILSASVPTQGFAGFHHNQQHHPSHNSSQSSSHHQHIPDTHPDFHGSLPNTGYLPFDTAPDFIEQDDIASLIDDGLAHDVTSAEYLSASMPVRNGFMMPGYEPDFASHDAMSVDQHQQRTQQFHSVPYPHDPMQDDPHMHFDVDFEAQPGGYLPEWDQTPQQQQQQAFTAHHQHGQQDLGMDIFGPTR
ncbi:hypothetical protein DFS34DRAFT_397850 [Phlyctochytrium arcticum]|nr:hypothetical protein DFS34DRAFT_397850 [Phlyctochytrium arcticum]